jgi:hypothetical protein
MVRSYLIYLIALVGLFYGACDRQSVDGGDAKEQDVFIPYVEADGKLIGKWSRQLLRRNGVHRIKMAHRLNQERDSSDHLIMKAFKNYDLVFTADTLSNYQVIYKSETLAKFIDVRNDTAYINIPFFHSVTTHLFGSPVMTS